MTDSRTIPRGWLIHDIVMGGLSGALVGLVVGLFAMARISDSIVFIAAGAAIGATLGVYGLIQSHRKSERFLTLGVVSAWVLFVLALIFLVGLILAISQLT